MFALLETAKVGRPKVDERFVSQLMLVTVVFPDLDDTETFLLGSRWEVPHTPYDVYSPTSPLGAAVLGQEIGSEISYQTPAGKEIRISIVSAEIYAG